MPSSARIFEPILFFLPQKEKNGFNLPRKERGHSKSEVQPVPPSCDNSLNRPHLPAPNHLSAGNYAPHAILMMAVISLPANTAKSKTSMRRKSRARLWSIEGVRGNHPKGFPGRLFLFLAARHGSFLSPNRERQEWGRKTPLALHFPPCVLQ